MVLFMALSARSSACRFPSPPASSSTRSCRQPIWPARPRLPFPGRHHRRVVDLPGDPGALGPAHRGTGLGDPDPRLLGPLAPAAEPVFRSVFLGRPGAASDGAERGLQEDLRGVAATRRDRASSRSSTWPCSFTIAGRWPLGTTLLMAVLLAVTVLLPGGPAPIRKLDPRDRRGDFRLCSWSFWAASVPFARPGRKAAPSHAGPGATPTGSRSPIRARRFRQRNPPMAGRLSDSHSDGSFISERCTSTQT